MNWDRIEGSWKRFRGSAKSKWAELTRDRLYMIVGRRDQLAGELQESHGVAAEAAERRIAEGRAPTDEKRP